MAGLLFIPLARCESPFPTVIAAHEKASPFLAQELTNIVRTTTPSAGS